jgi:LacI family transcriptional regulator
VQQAAHEAGYRRNPLAGALMSELRRSRGATFRGVLAVIEFNEPNRPADAALYHRELAAGVNARATELGFRTERFVVGRVGVSVPRLDSILQARGMHGVVVLPCWDEPDLSNLDWARFAGIYTDYVIERPRLHTVCPDHYRSLLTALQRLAARGYRRPGLYLQRHQDERLQYRWSAAFRAFEDHHPGIAPVPPLLVDRYRATEFVRWFQQYRPDVVVGHHAEAIGWMRDCGARVPATHGFFCLNLHMQARPCAGLDLQPRILGARSAELLIAQLQHNETGIPESPSTTTIPARWTEGPTLRLAGEKSGEVRLRSKAGSRPVDGRLLKSP